MTNDLVNSLREEAPRAVMHLHRRIGPSFHRDNLAWYLTEKMAYAAERIEALEAAIERIANYHPEITHAWAEDVREIARCALWGGKHE